MACADDGITEIAPALVTTLALECDGEPRQDHELKRARSQGKEDTENIGVEFRSVYQIRSEDSFRRSV